MNPTRTAGGAIALLLLAADGSAQDKRLDEVLLDLHGAEPRARERARQDLLRRGASAVPSLVAMLEEATRRRPDDTEAISATRALAILSGGAKGAVEPLLAPAARRPASVPTRAAPRSGDRRRDGRLR